MRKTTYIVLAISILVVLFLPTLLSIPPLKQVLIETFELKMKAKIDIATLRLSWLGPQKFKGIAFHTTDLNGTVEEIILNKPFWSLKSLPYSLTLSNGQVTAQNITVDQINASIEGNNVQINSSNFRAQGTASSDHDYNITYSASTMPTELVDWLLGAKGMLTAAIGSPFNANGYAKAGAFSLDLNSNSSRIALETAYDAHTITLLRPFFLRAMIPQQWSKTQLKKPIAFWDPVTLSVANEGFSYPRKFSLKKLSIPDANLNLGRLTVYKQEIPSALATWLKSPNLAKGQLDAWLTCCNFSFTNGVLQLDRIDALLAQQIPLAFWGQADLIKDQLSAVLGIPASVLASNFGLGGLSSDYVLQVPVTGTLENPQFDTSTGATKIAALIAGGTAQRVGGQWGQLIGGITNTATQAIQPPTPPPCQKPFPWER